MEGSDPRVLAIVYRENDCSSVLAWASTHVNSSSGIWNYITHHMTPQDLHFGENVLPKIWFDDPVHAQHMKELMERQHKAKFVS